MRLPLSPPPLDRLLEGPDVTGRLQKVIRADALKPTHNGKYLHWDELRYRTPPDDLSVEDWWMGVKFARQGMMRETPLRDRKGRPFSYTLADPVLELISGIDRDASGRIEISEQVTNPEIRDRYIVTSLIEEAASSSILEGAATTVKRAKEMIRSGEEPRDRSERMILNNYRAMRIIRDLTDEPLNPDTIFRLHRILTTDTLDDPAAAGRLRRPDDPEEDVVVTDRQDGTTLHVPPDAEELPDRLERMCAFANDDQAEPYLPPVLRAILLHFWLAYDHPFVDGNGRTARALFYWSMLRQGYWLTSFVSISGILRRAPAKYARSFLYTETDDNDLTYFILHQLHVLWRAIDGLGEFLAMKAREIRKVERLLRPSVGLNHRQLALLAHALRHPGTRYTIESHQTSHDIVYQTARTDLHELADRHLLVRRKVGRKYVYSPPADLVQRLQQLGD
ncbi:MAG: Fic family protein [Gemmatimonadota bacterium]